MRVLRISVPNQISGVFAAIPNPVGRPAHVVDFAVCQICRITSDTVILNNPADFLDWNATPIPNWIKINTLNIHNGWFVDNLFRDNAQNYLYYMESFTVEERQGLLDNANDIQEGGVLYISPNAAEGVSQENYDAKFLPRIVNIGQGNNVQYPFMQDTPQQAQTTILDFQVHLLYRSENNGDTFIHISDGFRWQYDGNNPRSPFQGLLVNASAEFVHCVQSGINLQNIDNNTAWQLA